MNVKVLLLATVFFLFFMGFILPREAVRMKEITGSTLSPDTSFIYTARDLYQMAEDYGLEGRSYYVQSRFRFDLIWPLVYLFFLVTSLSIVFGSLKDKAPSSYVNLLPFLAFFFDLLENGSASLVMYRYPLSTPLVVVLAPIFTFLKWITVGGSFLALLWGIIQVFFMKGGLQDH